MSYYHHSEDFQQQDTNFSNDTTEPLPSWETLDHQPQQPQDSPSDSHSAFVSPAAPIPHALPSHQFDFSPLHTPVEYGENPDFLFPSQQAGPSRVMNFAPQERLVQSEGYPSPEAEFSQPSPSPTTPTLVGPQRTRSRGTVPRGSSRGSATQRQHHPYQRPQSAMAGRAPEHPGARFSLVTGGGIQPYPASMSAPASEAGSSHASSTMPPPSIALPQRPSPVTVSIPASFHQPMGPPPEPSHPHPHPQPNQPRLPPVTIVPPSATAPNTDFGNVVRRIRAATKYFFTPRIDSFYDTTTHTLKAYLELPGVRRENLYVTLANSAITRHRSINVWGFSLSPNWLATVPSTGAGAASTLQEASSMTGTTMHMSSGSSSSTSNVSVPSTSVGEAAGTAQAPSTNSGGVADARPPVVTSSMEMSLGLGLPPQYSLRERRYGEFYRLLPVPPETRVRSYLHFLLVLYLLAVPACATHVQAVLEAGVLALFISFGTPLTEGQANAGREVISLSIEWPYVFGK
ncbi:hypothetical protein F5876DRAFT_74685 [Lentinula aff. lateritia]|uniref:Uncharacterized protein n=1 Tax=Lentinula aff. lateritia TaxID=2804960 RepID=A0ACC1U732_9AGAR|nr:hypothetical protein F5876DRAFT_74685 [Lentinula aff. lateritia]